MNKTKFNVIGLMSGSSLDGVDLAYCQFDLLKSGKLKEWKIIHGETLPYDQDWKEQLKMVKYLSVDNLAKIHFNLGHYYGELILDFIERNKISPDFISSHGHTVTHNPAEGYTLQIGEGAAIAKCTGLPCIDRFRYMDVAFGGQGAPVAPIADRDLFPANTSFLNIGGIANITFLNQDRRAFDIAPANQLFDYLADQKGLPYDDGGKLGAKGNPISMIMESLQKMDYFNQKGPKSLDNGFISQQILPIFKLDVWSIEDLLATAYHFVAMQVNDAFGLGDSGRCLVTGGGAYNAYLVELMQEYLNRSNKDVKLFLPAKEVIEYKEAVLMAWMGVLRYIEQPNCLKWATGADRDVCGGLIHLV